MCSISGGHRFPNRLNITARSAGRQARKRGRPPPPSPCLSAPDARRFPAQPAAVNVSLAEIIAVTQPSRPRLPHLPRSWCPTRPSQFQGDIFTAEQRDKRRRREKKWPAKGIKVREEERGQPVGSQLKSSYSKGETFVATFLNCDFKAPHWAKFLPENALQRWPVSACSANWRVMTKVAPLRVLPFRQIQPFVMSHSDITNPPSDHLECLVDHDSENVRYN